MLTLDAIFPQNFSGMSSTGKDDMYPRFYPHHRWAVIAGLRRCLLAMCCSLLMNAHPVQQAVCCHYLHLPNRIAEGDHDSRTQPKQGR